MRSLHNEIGVEEGHFGAASHPKTSYYSCNNTFIFILLFLLEKEIESMCVCL